MESQNNQTMSLKIIQKSSLRHITVYNAGMVDFEHAKSVGTIEIETPDCVFIKVRENQWVSFIKAKPTPSRRDKALTVLRNHICEPNDVGLWIQTRQWERRVYS